MPAWPRYFTAAGIVAAFLSTFFAHGFLRLARNLSAGEAVNPGWLGANLLRCNALNVAGIALTVVGLQASVGEWVGRGCVARGRWGRGGKGEEGRGTMWAGWDEVGKRWETVA